MTELLTVAQFKDRYKVSHVTAPFIGSWPLIASPSRKSAAQLASLLPTLKRGLPACRHKGGTLSMDDRKKNAPSAVTAALGANVEGQDANGQLDHYHSPRTPRKRIVVKAVKSGGQPFTVSGQIAKVLLALVKAGEAGITPLARETWSLRLSDHVRTLKHRHGLVIVTLWGKHDEGRHLKPDEQ